MIVAAYATLILILSVIPVRDGVLEAPYLDKLAHLGEYLLLAWLLVRAMRMSQVLQPAYALWAWIYATSYGLLIEVVQAMLPWRSAELADAAANALGAALGVRLGRRIKQRISRQKAECSKQQTCFLLTAYCLLPTAF